MNSLKKILIGALVVSRIAVVDDVAASPMASQSSLEFTKVTSDPLIGAFGKATGAVVADINHDGFVDVFVSIAYASNLLFTNTGTGHFVKVVPNSVASGTVASASAAWGDYDNDGFADLYVSVNGVENDLLYRNQGGGIMARVPSAVFNNVGGRGNGSAWADFDNDGFLDIYVANSDQNNYLHHNNGNGTFTKLTTNAIVRSTGNSQTVSWGDYDGDCLPDLFIGKGVGNNALFHNDGNGVFSPRPAQPMCKEGGGGAGVWVDYDNDGRSDLFVANTGQKCFLYHNDGNGEFSKITNSILTADVTLAGGNVWADFDNDGFLDLFICQIGRTNLLFHNNGDGTFAKATAGSLTSENADGSGAVAFDYDNDGFSDLFVPNYRSNAGSLYHNTGNSNHWLVVICEGRVSNRSAIGAKVRLKSTIRGKEVWQLREIGFQSDLRAYFGLGDAEAADTIVIEWPSGIRQELAHVGGKQFLRVIEPSRLRTSAGSGSGVFTLQLEGGPGAVYAVEESTDLVKWDLLRIVTNANTKPVAGTLQLTTPNRNQFFRAIERH